MNNNFDMEYDIVIIGGGAIGSSIALDATLRGYKTLLIEQNDFSSGTSCKSTKLLHGGVRYLEKAINELNLKQYALVNEALEERAHFLKNANHISSKIKLLTPIKKWYELIYYFIGLKLYDFISKNRSIGQTTIKNKNELRDLIPLISKEHNTWAVEYFDGTFNDSKLVIDILKTAEKFGATIKNYTKFEKFIYKDKKITALKAFDKVENREILIKTSSVFNATGHYVDSIRKVDDNLSHDITIFSKGSHLVISNSILNIKEGLLIPKTKDNRVIFILPWFDKYCLIGTTDIQTEFEAFSKVSEEEKSYLLSHINEYFDITIKQSDILSSWSGMRTLLKEDTNSQKIVREHIINISNSNLISICGGKWTTSRKIAEDTLNRAVDKNIIQYLKECETKKVNIIGFYKNKKILKKKIESYKLPEDIVKHILNTYGSESIKLLSMIKDEESFHRVLKDLPYTKAEVLYCLKYEYVKKPMDFLARRVRLAFFDKKRCNDCIEYIAKIIKEYYSLTKVEYESMIEEAKKELDEFF